MKGKVDNVPIDDISPVPEENCSIIGTEPVDCQSPSRFSLLTLDRKQKEAQPSLLLLPLLHHLLSSLSCLHPLHRLSPNRK